MTLQNLLGISLEFITPNKLFSTQLLKAAQRNISDAHIDAVSAEIASMRHTRQSCTLPWRRCMPTVTAR